MSYVSFSMHLPVFNALKKIKTFVVCNQDKAGLENVAVSNYINNSWHNVGPICYICK